MTFESFEKSTSYSFQHCDTYESIVSQRLIVDKHFAGLAKSALDSDN